MLKKLFLICGLLQGVALGGAHPVSAVIVSPQTPASPMEIVAAVPASTLLLPYFEVDLANSSGANTQFSINDSSATAMLAHVTIWSDLAVPVFSFNVYLTGYDVQVINLRNILNGKLPQTASAGQDPRDTISPKGDDSQDINFASCTGQLPLAPLSAATATALQNALTGKASADLGGKCAGLDHGDSIARGYVTIDSVNTCTLKFPDGMGYFAAGGTGEATNQTNLWGDFLYTNNPSGINKAGGPLVHIRSSATDSETSVAGQYTFYGRYTNWTAADNRQPLPSTFAARYFKNTNLPGGTSLIVWRDPKVAQSAFTCGNLPSWYPLGQESLVAFDEQEHPTTLSGAPFGAATQRVRVGGAALPIASTAGWLYLNLNTPVAAAGANPSEDQDAAQAWVSTIQDTGGPRSLWQPASALDSAAVAHHEP
jgi:hypothetical protein